MIYPVLKKILFQFQPEFIHETIIEFGKISTQIPGLLKTIEKIAGFNDQRLKIKIGDLVFPNPIGLAAGFDKNGEVVPLLQSLGFGSLELGTVTPVGQAGNPKPRLFRLKEDAAIINRMGFNNKGVDHLVNQLVKCHTKIPIGINLGKNKNTPLEKAYTDYVIGLKKAWLLGDYFTINISSPNTKNLRDLQQEDYLLPLLKKIIATRDKLAGENNHSQKQIWLKIAPDLTETAIRTIIDIALQADIDALIVSNTTISRPPLRNNAKIEVGGLSGKPLQTISDRTLKVAADYISGKIPVIGVGGIFNAEDVYRKLTLGASMVQVYTGFIYEGPVMVKKINKQLIKLMDEKNIKNISDINA